jgi:hypothetical protein
MWIFFIFWSSKIHISPTDVISSLSPPDTTSPPADVATLLCRITLSFHWAKTSSLHPLHFSVMLYHVVSPLESKPMHWIHTTTTGHTPQTAWLLLSTAIKNIISILATLPTAQPRLHFASFLARSPRHRSSTRHHHSLSSLSHSHRPSIQQHPRWWTSRLTFTPKQLIGMTIHVKRYFKITQHRMWL